MEQQNDDDNQTYKQFEISDGIVFLIELTSDIFQPLKELGGKSQLLEILGSINDLIAELIISLPNTGVGIYFYNCEDTNRKFPKMSGLNRLFKLNDINSFNMKILNDAINDDMAGIKLLKETFPSKEVVEGHPVDERLSIVLSTILDEFHARQFYNRRKLVWFASNEKPYESEKAKRHLWKIINDYEEFGVYINPFFLNKVDSEGSERGRQFDATRYQDIFLNTCYLNSYASGQNDSVRLKNENAASSNYYDLVFDGVSKQSSRLKKATVSTQIRSAILRVKEVNRMQFSCNLILGDGKNMSGNFGCSIRGYSMYQPAKLRKFKKLYTHGGDLKVVYSENKFMNERTNDEVKIVDPETNQVEADNDEVYLRKGFALGNDKVLYLNNKQLNFMKNYTFDNNPYEERTFSGALKLQIANDFEEPENENDDNVETLLYRESGKTIDLQQNEFTKPPYLKLLGFRNANTFPYQYNFSNPVLVTPDITNGFLSAMSSGGYNNSYKTFSSLYQSCHKLKKYALVFGCLKRNSLPNLYVLYPTRIINSTREGYDFPEGFLLIRQPWLDDVRSLPESITSTIMPIRNEIDEHLSSDLKEKIKALLSKFSLKEYKPADISNPSLNYFYKVLKSELLQEEMKDKSRELLENDHTLQTLAGIHRSINEDPSKLALIRDINLDMAPLQEVLPPKRLSKDTSSAAYKKRKQK